MKYGESIFGIAYLIFAISTGIFILLKRRDRIGRLTGSSVLVLGCGDAFHLVPRVLRYFTDTDLTRYLGFGKLVTSITMTIFYLLLYRLWLVLYAMRENRKLSFGIYVLTALRIILCLMPQNQWLQNESPMTWNIIRNIPFIALGCINIWLYFQKRADIKCLRNAWLLITFSFLFYIPVAVLSGLYPLLGILMLPKTVCYVLLICCYVKYLDVFPCFSDANR